MKTLFKDLICFSILLSFAGSISYPVLAVLPPANPFSSPRHTLTTKSYAPVFVSVCAAAVIGLLGWAWWNDYITLPGEHDAQELAEAAQGAQVSLQVKKEPTLGVDAYSVSGSSLGDVEVVQEYWTASQTLNLKTTSGHLLAKGEREVFTTVSTINVDDPSGQRIGSLKKDWGGTLSSWGTVYSILDAGGNEIASSERIQTLTKHFTLTSSDGRVIARVDGEFGTWFDNWHVNIYDKSIIDERLLVLLPAFQSSSSK